MFSSQLCNIDLYDDRRVSRLAQLGILIKISRYFHMDNRTDYTHKPTTPNVDILTVFS